MRGALLVLVSALALRATAAQDAQAPQPAPATPEEQALAGWDEETALWFPPDAPRQVYLDRTDPQHNLILDARKAFEANPALARAVAALMNDPKREPNAARLTGRVKQTRTMFAMLVIGFLANEEEKPRQDAAWREQEEKYERWMDLERARAMPVEERRAAWARLQGESEGSMEQDGRLRASFARLGLLPQADTSIYGVLAANPWSVGLPGPKFLAFLRRVIEREAAEGRPEAGRWSMALRNLHFYLGELEPARSLSHAFLGREDLKAWENDNRVFSAVIDRLAGDPAPLRAALAACAVPESDRNYCPSVAHWLSVRFAERVGAKSPRTLVELLAEDTLAHPVDWPIRLDSIRHLESIDPARARSLADDLLHVPATIPPLAARLDALAVVGRTSATLKDFARAQGAWDFYLANLRYRPAPVPPDLWARLASVPESETAVAPPDSGWFEITSALGHKVEAATAARDFPLARRSIEELVAASLALADSAKRNADELWKMVDEEAASVEDRRAMREMFETEKVEREVTARVYLRWARQLVRDLGTELVAAKRPAEAKRVAQYLLGNAGAEHNLIPGLMELKIQAVEVRHEEFPVAAAPWETASR